MLGNHIKLKPVVSCRLRCAQNDLDLNSFIRLKIVRQKSARVIPGDWLFVLVEQVRHQMHVAFFGGALNATHPTRVTTVVKTHAEPQLIIWTTRGWSADQSEL